MRPHSKIKGDAFIAVFLVNFLNKTRYLNIFNWSVGNYVLTF